MEPVLALAIFIIFIALVFDYTNGMHDAANSIATIVSTRVLSPGVAVAWAAFFNFIAFAVYGTAVAKMIGGGLINLKPIPKDLHLYVLLAGLVGVITWNIITWYLGLPTSSSHALIGGYAGSAIAAYGGFAVIVPSGWYLTLTFIILAPLIGLTLGYVMMLSVFWIFRNSSIAKLDKGFRVAQLFSAAAFSLGHGGNDAQKTMGIITVVLVSIGYFGSQDVDIKTLEIPLWVVLSAHAAIGLGTLTGGWRIVKTMGSKIAKLQPVGGFCAETAGALTLAFATLSGYPVSTTHTITGAIVGVGVTKRVSAVKWGVAGKIVWAWILTIPMSAIIGGITFYIVLFISKLFS
jgi:inorganic phosphate transporter, PiT family